MNSKDPLLSEILLLVEQYINEKHRAKKWTAGEDWVRYSGPYFSSEEYVKAVSTLMSEWLVMGKDCHLFERKFPKYFGKSHGVLTNSGSSANLLMMSALTSKRGYALKKGAKVITPIAGFPTTLNPIFQVGFEPIFVDIEIQTLNLDLTQVEEAAKQGARVITFAHVLGNPPNMDQLMSLVEKHKLILLEDCCDALGSTYKDKPLGSFGDMASCSFYPAHHITMGEGGFVATKDSELQKIVRSFREWGRACYCSGEKANLLKNGTCNARFSNWIPSLPEHVFDHKYVYDEIGYNIKPLEVQASMGLVQLTKMEEIDRLRKKNYNSLFKIFSKYEEFFHMPRATKHSDPSWFAFPLTLKNDCPFSRSQITEFFEDNKIQTRNYFAGNIMLQPGYSHLIDPIRVIEEFPVARKVTTDTFFLGTSPVITDEQVKYIEFVADSFFAKDKK